VVRGDIGRFGFYDGSTFYVRNQRWIYKYVINSNWAFADRVGNANCRMGTIITYVEVRNGVHIPLAYYVVDVKARQIIVRRFLRRRVRNIV